MFEPNSKIYNIYFLSIIHSFCNHLSLLKAIMEPYTISFDVVLISIKLLCILFILEHWNFQKNTYPFSWESVHEGFYHRPNCFLPTIRSLPDKHLMIHSGPKKQGLLQFQCNVLLLNTRLIYLMNKLLNFFHLCTLPILRFGK